jgi:hypothetical protein
MLPLLIRCVGVYGSWLFFLCNHTQHIGLQDNVPDRRRGSRQQARAVRVCHRRSPLACRKRA